MRGYPGEKLMAKVIKWKNQLESKGLKVNPILTKVTFSGGNQSEENVQ